MSRMSRRVASSPLLSEFVIALIRFALPFSSLTRRISRSRHRSLALVLSASLLLTSIVPPHGASATGVAGYQSSALSGLQYFAPSGLGRLLVGTVLMLLQGGPPSVPGPNLPDLDAARQIQPSDPIIAPSIPSEQICIDCDPCPGCTNNNPPVAVSGGPYSGNTTDPISFNGSASFDPDGDVITFQWNFGDGGTATGPTPIHVYTTQGTFNVTLTVTDSQGLSDQGSTTASVSAPPAPTPTPPPPTGSNGATFVSQTVPETMAAGGAHSASVTMRNSGSTTWTAARLYRLGSQNPQDNGTWGLGRVTLPGDVLPGAQVTFNFTVIAPPGAGCDIETGTCGTPYDFQWRMVQDGVEWFGDYSANAVVTSIQPYSPYETYGYSHYAERLKPRNRTGTGGEDLASGNFNWSVPVLELAGRAGLNLNLDLAYNSLPWTRVNTVMIFDADRGFPGPGFRLGFPSIQPQFYHYETSANAYLLIMPSGRRVELRQVTDRVYEATDSSNLQLTDGGSGLLLRAADGSQMSFVLINGEYRCTGIRDLCGGDS